MSKKESFIQLIKQHEGIIYKVTRIYAIQVEDQKDLYQEIVYQLWKSFDSFEGRAKLSTWIYRVALNTSIVFAKRKGRHQHLPLIALEDLRALEYTNELQSDRLRLLHQQIQRLNDLEKGIMLLFLEGKSHEEIAAIIGFTKTNIGTRISRIKQKLKMALLK